MIPGIPSMGGLEVLIVLVIILLFFGAKRIPELGRSLGKGTREFRKGISEGAAADEAQDHPEKDREEPSLDGATRGETPGVKAETSRAE